MQGLSNIEELVLGCRTARARDLIDDAFRAYRAGAYRAAIVTTWIAVVFDIVDKLRELSSMGDKAAKAELATFDRHVEQIHKGDTKSIKSALEFERNVLVLARDRFLFLDQYQYIDLERLREDRNRCAHPTFQREEQAYHPSAELARTHLRNAIAHVLQQPPVQGKAAIQAIETTVLSEYFPTNFKDARIALEEGPLRKATDALVRGVVDCLLFGLFETGSPHRGRGQTLAALAAVVQLHHEVAEERVKTQTTKIAAALPDADLRLLVALTCQLSSALDGLSGAQKTRILTFLRAAGADDIARLLPLASRVPDYLGAVQDCINRMPREDLAVLVSRRPSKEATARAAELFSNSRSWSEANLVAETVVLPLARHFTPEQVRMIFSSPREKGSDLRQSGGAASFAHAVCDNRIMDYTNLVELLKDEGFEYLVPALRPPSDDDEIPF